MKVHELIELLEEQSPGSEVRLAIQPSWPFEHSISNELACSEEAEVECEVCERTGGMHDEECPNKDKPAKVLDPVVYIAEGRQLDYLPGWAQDHLGWGRRNR